MIRRLGSATGYTHEKKDPRTGRRPNPGTVRMRVPAERHEREGQYVQRLRGRSVAT